jgi:hypothetical protein
MESPLVVPTTAPPVTVVFAWAFRGGAALWMVVRVVVIDLTEFAGDENVLFLSQSVFAAVALVPALEFAASDAAVSAVVDRVGALDLTCA